MMLNMQRLARQLDTLRRAVWPEYSEPFYLVFASELDGVGSANAAGGAMAGGFHSALCWSLQSLIQKRGDWAGPGVTIVMNLATIARSFSECSTASRKRLVPRMIEAVFVHELAHAADLGVWPEPLGQREAEIQHAICVQACTVESSEVRPPVEIERLHHGPRFIRAALHLAVRAEAAGYPVTVGDVADTGRYGLAGTWSYRAALSHELATTQARRLDDILTSEPPARFTKLWELDNSNQQKRDVA